MGVWFQNDSKLVQIRRKINADLFETKLIKTAMSCDMKRLVRVLSLALLLLLIA